MQTCIADTLSHRKAAVAARQGHLRKTVNRIKPNIVERTSARITSLCILFRVRFLERKKAIIQDVNTISDINNDNG
jgi:hypothetical protein